MKNIKNIHYFFICDYRCKSSEVIDLSVILVGKSNFGITVSEVKYGSGTDLTLSDPPGKV